MADEADLAQAESEQFQGQVMAARAAARSLQLKNLPLCADCEENPVFVTDKGTITRICKQCYEEVKASKTVP